MIAQNRTGKVLWLGFVGALVFGSVPGNADDGDNPVVKPDFEPAIFDNLGSDPLHQYDVSGGAVTQVLTSTFYTDFKARTGITVRPDFNTDNSKWHAAVDANQAQWSIVQFDGAAAARSEKNGELLPLNKDILPLHLMNDGAYTDHVLRPWKVGVILTWNKDLFPNEGPDTIQKFFDRDAFPGKRCLFRAAQGGGVLEAGMAAGGVDAGSIYPLDTAFAFKQLDRIKNDIVWFTSADQAQRALKSGDCAMGILWANRVYQSVHSDNANLGHSWNFGVTDTVYYAVPKSAPNPRAGQALLAMFILDRKAGAEMASKIALAPDLKDPLPVDDSLQPYLAVGANTTHTIQSDTAWYGDNITRLSDEFNEWLLAK